MGLSGYFVDICQCFSLPVNVGPILGGDGQFTERRGQPIECRRDIAPQFHSGLDISSACIQLGGKVIDEQRGTGVQKAACARLWAA
jgi:hypothetical protein